LVVGWYTFWDTVYNGNKYKKQQQIIHNVKATNQKQQKSEKGDITHQHIA